MPVSDYVFDALKTLGFFFASIVLILVSSLIIYNFLMLSLPFVERRYRTYIQNRIRLNHEHIAALNEIRQRVLIEGNDLYAQLRYFGRRLHQTIVATPIMFQLWFGVAIYHILLTAYNSPNFAQRLVRRIVGYRQDDEYSQEEEDEDKASWLVQVVENRVDSDALTVIVESEEESNASFSTISMSTGLTSVAQVASTYDLDPNDLYSVLIYYVEPEQRRNFVGWIRQYKERNIQEIPPHVLASIRIYDRALVRAREAYAAEQLNFLQRFYREPRVDSSAWPMLRSAAISAAHNFHMQVVEMPDLHMDTIIVAMVCMILIPYIPVMPCWFVVFCVFRYNMVGKIYRVILCLVSTILLYVVVIKMYVYAGSMGCGDLPKIFIFLMFLTLPVFGEDVVFAASLGFVSISFVKKDEELGVAIALVATLGTIGFLLSSYAFLRIVIMKIDAELEDLEMEVKSRLRKFH